MVIVYIALDLGPDRKESFITTNEKFVYKKGDKIYDSFYAGIYDNLVYNKVKNDFEFSEFKKNTKPTTTSVILDIGSGTGHHVNTMVKKGYQAQGLDNSEAMVKIARKNYPKNRLDVGSALDTLRYSPSTFTHITCFYFTIYYIKDKNTFFKNCYTWLMPGGYLMIHLVDRTKFNPILEAGDPLTLISPQKYAPKRITSTYVTFNDFDYKSNFRLDESRDKAYMEEYFMDKSKEKAMKNEHELYMPTQKHILNLAKRAGFILDSKLDMVDIEYEYQYLYVLHKPYH
jgi:SAM-dependent methyltransferase